MSRFVAGNDLVAAVEAYAVAAAVVVAKLDGRIECLHFPSFVFVVDARLSV